ncbi:hypothetical protein [Sphingobacterium lactis]|uniref:Outer membrane protein beta-barrel domain-containing protein n=1 Tax=Sphingobacterium lactis TaxID=797291 RepID=A0A1H5Z4G3_9SPHI|nr:hypothetical protein [Sphingobacterium lactis]SEG31218.1 hypothetical protein SAMN05421877_106247 [Sphingobacterium lactis]
MEQKNRKDIVEHIIERMKATDELPYRAGAWENFQQRHGGTPIRRTKPYYWAASAAAILLFGALAVTFWPQQQAETSGEQLVKQDIPQTQASPNSSQELSGEQQGQITEQPSGQAEDMLQSGLADRQIAHAPTTPIYGGAEEHAWMSIQQTAPWQLQAGNAVHVSAGAGIHSSSVQRRDLQIAALQLPEEDGEAGFREIMPVNGQMAHETNGNVLASGPNGQQLRDRKFSFREKFDLGLFVSPGSTNENFNVGGGLVLAYNINKNLSVRTGLGYNRYEVSTLKDPLSNQGTEVYASKETLQKVSSHGLQANAMSNSLILPNINAVSGNVQALEVPLDVKYKFAKGFYASSGVTYAAVINQNRYTHYIENANSELLSQGLPGNTSEMRNQVKQVSKAIKTDDENVKQGALGGFVNFSLGKEVKMKKGISLSVEPFVKLPVGSFKSADMNYTNGGIRVITNF